MIWEWIHPLEKTILWTNPIRVSCICIDLSLYRLYSLASLLVVLSSCISSFIYLFQSIAIGSCLVSCTTKLIPFMTHLADIFLHFWKRCFSIKKLTYFMLLVFILVNLYVNMHINPLVFLFIKSNDFLVRTMMFMFILCSPCHLTNSIVLDIDKFC